ncbi:hypothetical protein REJC140_02341 [Pseudorhizobium endolithicum]|uniref:Uncharacterized protein n=1 Tax=Pseudorhizobium endolithicum TaxID=1191678 RepID=A0ABM8PF34_9HYPH|nr:hypothetical protein REJC140_02341 [Pseudorhizobium endolithicum]
MGLYRAVVTFAALRILEYLIGAANFGEAVRRGRVVLVMVGVNGFCFGTPGSLDLVGAGIPLHTKNRIGIAHE